MSQPIYLVDAFTSEAFGGNPAAVVVCNTPAEMADDSEGNNVKRMQALGAEMNQAETAFVAKLERLDDKNTAYYHIRWFTPTKESPLCGHATLASAHTLWSQGYESFETKIEFKSVSGSLFATRNSDGQVCLDFPLEKPSPIAPQSHLFQSLGLRLSDDAKDHPQVIDISKNRMDTFVVIKGGHQAISEIQPDFQAMNLIDTRCVVVTSSDRPDWNPDANGMKPVDHSSEIDKTDGPKDGGQEEKQVKGQDKKLSFDFVSRVFAPADGITEDPVTGSAHCGLIAVWSQVFPQSGYTAFQASSRGGVVNCSYLDNGQRVQLSGYGFCLIKGQVNVKEGFSA